MVCFFFTWLTLNMMFMGSKYIGIKTTLTLRGLINRRPTSSKGVSKTGLHNMATTMILLTEIDFSSTEFDGPINLPMACCRPVVE